MAKEAIRERRDLWLSWLETPWDLLRDHIAEEMRRVGMSHDDLAFEMRAAGYRVTSRSIGNWLRRPKHGPTFEAIQTLVEVFARVSAGEWSKGSSLSSLGLAYDLRLPDEPTLHDPKYRHLGSGSQDGSEDFFRTVDDLSAVGLSA